MNILLIIVLLALLVLLALVLIRRQSAAPKQPSQVCEEQADSASQSAAPLKPDANVNWDRLWRTEAWAIDKDAYKAIDNRTKDMMLSAVSNILGASKSAAVIAYRQAREADMSVELARQAALDAYRAAYTAAFTEAYWHAEWQQNAWEMAGDAYRAVANLLDDEQGYLTLASLDAISRVQAASEKAAIAAYRQASESKQAGEASKKAAYEAYRLTFATKLAEEKRQQADSVYVHQQLNRLAPAQIQQIEQRMQPNSDHSAGHEVTSATGFLQPGEHLLDIIAHDEQTLQALRITPEQVADCLERCVAKARRQQELAKKHQQADKTLQLDTREGERRIDERFVVTLQTYLGEQACPFEDETGQICGSSLYGDTNFTIRNLQTNETLAGPGLIIHLIRMHHFFEGSVKYRVEPQRAVEVLELQPGVNYQPRYRRLSVWRCNQGTGATGEAELTNFPFLQKLRDHPVTVVTLDETTQLYVRGNDCLSIAEHPYPVPPTFTVDGTRWDDHVINPGIWGFIRSDEASIELTQ